MLTLNKYVRTTESIHISRSIWLYNNSIKTYTHTFTRWQIHAIDWSTNTCRAHIEKRRNDEMGKIECHKHFTMRLLYVLWLKIQSNSKEKYGFVCENGIYRKYTIESVLSLPFTTNLAAIKIYIRKKWINKASKNFIHLDGRRSRRKKNAIN